MRPLLRPVDAGGSRCDPQALAVGMPLRARAATHLREAARAGLLRPALEWVHGEALRRWLAEAHGGRRLPEEEALKPAPSTAELRVPPGFHFYPRADAREGGRCPEEGVPWEFVPGPLAAQPERSQPGLAAARSPARAGQSGTSPTAPAGAPLRPCSVPGRWPGGSWDRRRAPQQATAGATEPPTGAAAFLEELRARSGALLSASCDGAPCCCSSAVLVAGASTELDRHVFDRFALANAIVQSEPALGTPVRPRPADEHREEEEEDAKLPVIPTWLWVS